MPALVRLRRMNPASFLLVRNREERFPTSGNDTTCAIIHDAVYRKAGSSNGTKTMVELFWQQTVQTVVHGNHSVTGELYISKEWFPTSGNDKKLLSSFPVVIPACLPAGLSGRSDSSRRLASRIPLLCHPSLNGYVHRPICIDSGHFKHI